MLAERRDLSKIGYLRVLCTHSLSRSHFGQPSGDVQPSSITHWTKCEAEEIMTSHLDIMEMPVFT
jgi:hypothetical protein